MLKVCNWTTTAPRPPALGLSFYFLRVCDVCSWNYSVCSSAWRVLVSLVCAASAPGLAPRSHDILLRAAIAFHVFVGRATPNHRPRGVSADVWSMEVFITRTGSRASTTICLPYLRTPLMCSSYSFRCHLWILTIIYGPILILLYRVLVINHVSISLRTSLWNFYALLSDTP